MSPLRRIQAFKVIAVLEAFSWLGLLIGMYVKYFTDAGEMGVKIFGPIHGGVFITYVVLTLVVARTQRWPVVATLVGLACSIPPFASLVFEQWAQRTGHLDATAQNTSVGSGEFAQSSSPSRIAESNR